MGTERKRQLYTQSGNVGPHVRVNFGCGSRSYGIWPGSGVDAADQVPNHGVAKLDHRAKGQPHELRVCSLFNRQL